MSALIHGMAIFTDQVPRDEWFDRWQDYIDGTVDVVPWPHSVYPNGLAKYGSRTGETLSGPAFSVSIKASDLEFLDIPEGNGHVSALTQEMEADPTIDWQWGTIG